MAYMIARTGLSRRWMVGIRIPSIVSFPDIFVKIRDTVLLAGMVAGSQSAHRLTSCLGMRVCSTCIPFKINSLQSLIYTIQSTSSTCIK